ncbi:MAG: hypothetical protein KC561_13655, partial [Myxococcales bacterium]|nr:hypothetical protein [Myxococcales bacterium]
RVTDTFRTECSSGGDDSPEGTQICVQDDDVKTVRVYLPDGRVSVMEQSPLDPARWTFYFRVRDTLGTGSFPVAFEVVDQAGNSRVQEATLEVFTNVASLGGGL